MVIARSIFSRYFPLMLLCLFIACSIAACADPYVTATYRPLETGSYRLDFVLYTDYGHGSSYGWGLYTTEITGLVAPDGWRAVTDTRKTNWDSLSSEYDVSPGSMLTGCAGTFALLPTQLNYFIRLTGAGGGIDGTLTPTPAPVPEPSSILALFGGLAGIGGLALRRRK
ncbi:MAG: PEP-CTERM sorting domain-containing protein [Armatimonadota bacterium]